MTESASNPQNLTFERLMEVLAEKIAARVCQDPCRLYPRLLTIAQAAAYLGLTFEIVEQAIAEHKLSIVRIDRRTLIDRDDLDRWIEESKLGWADIGRGRGAR